VDSTVFDDAVVISSFSVDHGCDLGGHVEDAVVDVTAQPG
jgi:hypothetical protein